MNQLKREIQIKGKIILQCFFSIYYKIFPIILLDSDLVNHLTKVSCLRTNLNEILFQIQALWKSKLLKQWIK